MFEGKILRSVRSGNYSVKLVSWDRMTTDSGVEGLKLKLAIETGETVRHKDALLFGFAAEAACEGLCDQWDRDFESLADLMDFFKLNKARVLYTKKESDTEYDQWSF